MSDPISLPRWGRLAALLLLLSGCGVPPLPTPTASPAPTFTQAATPTPAPTQTREATSTPPPTATSVPSASASPPSASVAAPTRSEKRYTNPELGIQWEAPEGAWQFSEAPALAQAAPGLNGLVALNGPDGVTLSLNYLSFEAQGLGAMGTALAKNPDLFLNQAAEAMGLPEEQVQRVEVGGSPALRIQMSAQGSLHLIVGNTGVYYLTAQHPAGGEPLAEEALAVEGLRFEGLPVAAAITPLPDDATPEEQRETIIAQVETLRQLSSEREVPFEWMTREALRDELEEDLKTENDPEELAAADRQLKLLGLIPPETNLQTLLLDLYGDQVAGFYDPEEDNFYLINDAAQGQLSVQDRVTFAHEMVHAIQDQSWELDDFLDDERYNDDEIAAAKAVIEGDAQTVTGLYLVSHLSPEEMGSLASDTSELDTEVLDRTPPFLRESLIFPYTLGARFVQAQLGAERSWATVDALYSAMPRSTEQILHPERYPSDQPHEVVLPDLLATLGEGWTEHERNVWGEWSLRLMLDQFLGSDEASAAAEGWGGDRFLFLSGGEGRDLFALVHRWDSPSEATEFREAGEAWLGAAGFEPRDGLWHSADGRLAQLGGTGDQTVLVVAHQEADLRAVWPVLEGANE